MPIKAIEAKAEREMLELVQEEETNEFSRISHVKDPHGGFQEDVRVTGQSCPASLHPPFEGLTPCSRR